MKPSEINAKLAEVEAQVSPLRESLGPLLEQAEALKKQKADIINAYGVKLRRIRDETTIGLAPFAAFRTAVYAADEDDRGEMIDAKMRELELE